MNIPNIDNLTSAPEAGAGALLLDEVFAYLGRFVSYPDVHSQVAHTLWILHTYFMDRWESTPRLAFLSPEPASGKTRALEASEPLLCNPVHAMNVSPAYLFRRVGDPDGRPVILFDEIDAVFGPKAKSDNEDLRALLNAGHRKGAIAGRVVVRAKSIETVDFPAYAAVALAGLGMLPDTILTRSVVVKMRRRSAGEAIEPFRPRLHHTEGWAIRDRLEQWAGRVEGTLAWPVMPEGIEDRDADIWEALIAVADASGGEWPQRARVAAVALVAASKASVPSLGVRLLADIKTVFKQRDWMLTDDLLAALNGLDEAPWSELVKGKPLNARSLANYLRNYGVGSKNIRQGEKVQKGYERAAFQDAWTRYVHTLPLDGATAATAATDDEGDGEGDDEGDDAYFTACTECGGRMPAARLFETCTACTAADQRAKANGAR